MKKYIILFISLLLMTFYAVAQDTVREVSNKKKQKSFLVPGKPWTVELPVWIPGFAGSFAYGEVTIEGEDGVDPEHPVEPPPGGIIGEILSRLFTKDWYLKFFFLTKIAYENNRFLVQLDGFTGAVGHSTKFNYNNQQVVQANFRSTNLRLVGGYKVVNAYSKNRKFRYELFGYIGVRAYFQNVTSDLDGLYDHLNFHPFWIEPVLGLQNQFTFKRWMIVLQGDYGGFFVSSKYSTQYTGYVYYRAGKFTSVKLGWNHLRLNQKGVFLKQDYNIKATFSGPAVGVVFHF